MKQEPSNKPPRFVRYHNRDRLLRGMGFASYRAYTNSPLWASIRQRVLERDKGVCHACGKSNASQVHHTSYVIEVLQGLNIAPLKSICAGCHRRIEFGKDSKLTLTQANRKLRRKRKRRAREECWNASPEFRLLAIEYGRLRRLKKAGRTFEQERRMKLLKRQMNAAVGEKGKQLV